MEVHRPPDLKRPASPVSEGNCDRSVMSGAVSPASELALRDASSPVRVDNAGSIRHWKDSIAAHAASNWSLLHLQQIFK